APAELRANGRAAQRAKQSTCVLLGTRAHTVRAAGTSRENGTRNGHSSNFECRHLDPPKGTLNPPPARSRYREARIGAKLRRATKTIGRRLYGWQHQLGAQPAERRRPERQPATIKPGEFKHDRKAQAGSRLRLVEPTSALGHLLALGRRESAPVVVDNDPHNLAFARCIRA